MLDIGCNQGGMLYELSNRIKYGVGIDYDSRMINVANKIKSHNKLNHLDYYVFDLEKEQSIRTAVSGQTIGTTVR